MKTIILITALVSFNAFAIVPNEIAKFVGKNGTLSNGSPCTIALSIYNDDYVEILESESQFKPSVGIKDAERSVKNDGTVVYESTEDGKYGNDQATECGNYPLISYKKTLEIKGRELTIRTKIRCFLDGKSEIVYSCKI